MGWGTFIASRMISDIKVRDAAWDNEKFERSMAQREDDANKLRAEFVRYALEDTVLGSSEDTGDHLSRGMDCPFDEIVREGF